MADVLDVRQNSGKNHPRHLRAQNRSRYNLALGNEHRNFTTDLLWLGMGASALPRLVCQSLWHTHGAATRRLAVDSRQTNHADFRPNRFGENAGGGVSDFDLGLIANRRFHFPD